MHRPGTRGTYQSTSRGALGMQTAEPGRAWKSSDLRLFLSFGCAGSLLLCRLFSSCRERELLSCCGAQALGAQVSVVAGGRLSRCSPRVLELALSSSKACGIFPDQGRNPGPHIGRQALIHCAAREVQNILLAVKKACLSTEYPVSLIFQV